MKALLLAASAAFLVTACTTAPGEEIGMAEPASAGMPAPAYVEAAASGDMFEIQSGQLALQRSCDPSVRSFAQTIVGDHSRMSDQLMTAANSAGLQPPSGMLPRHREMLERLQTEPAATFEAAFRTEQLMAHREARNLHRSYADEGDHSGLRAVAAQAVPAIEMHLGHAESLPATATCPAPMVTEPQRRLGERG